MDAKQDFSRGSMAGNILRMAIPMTIAQMVNVLYSVVDRFFIGHIDGASSMALTGVGIVFPIISVITAFTNLFGMGGAQPVLGYNYGAGEYRRVKQGILFMTAVCLVYMLAAWGLVFAFPHELMGLFTDNQELVETGAGMLHIYFFGFCFMAFQMSGQATFTGLGKAKFAIFFSLFRKVALVLPLIFILLNFLGVDGVLWSEPISNLVGGGACFLVMMLTLWRKL